MSTSFREAPDEQLRINSLLRLLPAAESVLEIGGRDGYISRRLGQRYKETWALDLTKPEILAPNIVCVARDVRCLAFEDNRFDVVRPLLARRRPGPKWLHAVFAKRS